MAENIDPGFIGVPVLERSSFDPVQFAREAAAGQTAKRQKRLTDISDRAKEGAEMFDMDIEAWEDQAGFDEITKDLGALEQAFVKFNTSGFDVINPKTSDEAKMQKAINQGMRTVQQKHDLWQLQKDKVSAARKVIDQQMELPEEERTIDIDATGKNINQFLQADNIKGRSGMMNTLLTSKRKPVDLFDYVSKTIKNIVPGTDELVKQWEVDPDSGKVTKTTWEGVKPERAIAGMKKLYNNMPEDKKKEADVRYEADQDKGLMNKEDWFISQFIPEYGEKFKKTQTSGPGSIGLEFGGALPQKDPTTGRYNLTPEPKSYHYATSQEGATDKQYNYNSAGSIPLEGMFAKAFPTAVSENTINTQTGKVEEKGGFYYTTPVAVSFLPVAEADMTVKVTDPKTGAKVEETVKAGETIPSHIQSSIDAVNQENISRGRPVKYQYKYDAFADQGINYKQVEDVKDEMERVPNIYAAGPDIASFNRSTQRPYSEVRKDYFAAAAKNKKNWGKYDQIINEMLDQLNPNFDDLLKFEGGGTEATAEEITKKLDL